MKKYPWVKQNASKKPLPLEDVMPETTHIRLEHTYDAMCDTCGGVCIKNVSKTPTHTPTPWNLGGYQTNSAAVEPLGVVGIGNGSKAIARAIHTGLIEREEAEANAAFIVRTVNAHSELLELAYWVRDSFKADERPENVAALIARAEVK